MDVNKAAYWIALGVFALALNSEYRQGNFITLHRVAERADSAFCQIATRTEQVLADARVTSQNGFPAGNLLASAAGDQMVRAQRELGREQAREKAEVFRDLIREQIRDQVETIRAQAEMRRAEIEQIRLRTRSQFRFAGMTTRRVTVTCPKTGALIYVSTGLESADVSPDAEVDDSF